MIKANTLPNLPDIYEAKQKKKKKKIKKKSRYYVHVETENISFLKMAKSLEVLNVQNNDFFLALYDTSLIGVDPYDEDLDLETQARIIAECTRNYWYFIREVVRIEVAGGYKPYTLHRGNLAISWCFLNNFDLYAELPRQNGKSIAVDVLLLWTYNFGTTNSTMLVMNKEHKDAKENLERIRNIRSQLPKYLRFDTKFNAENKELKLPENKEDAFNPKTKNKLVTKPCATSNERADKLGRGMTSPIAWWDEFAFLKFNMTIYEAASPATSQAAREAEAHGKPHCKLITTTPGDMSTQYGRDAYVFRNKCAPFSEEYYDWDIDDVRETLNKNSDNRFFNINFSYAQLGRDSTYFDDMVVELSGNMFKVRREVLLEWVSMADECPFDPADVERLAALTIPKDKATAIHINKYYTLNQYKPVDKNITAIISCDVATGASRDFSTIVVTDSKSKEAVAEFYNNKVDSLEFADIIYTISKELYPNSMIVIERNNTGSSVISLLLRTDVRGKIYYEVMNNDLQQKVKDGRTVDSNKTDSRNFGLYTTDERRNQMMELLLKFVKYYPTRVNIPMLSEQIRDLVYNKKSRIDHKPEGHDDVVMGYLVGIWVLYYGKNIGKYGILRLPDVDPETGKTPDEVYYEEMYREEQKRENMNKNFAMINSANGETPTIHQKQYKTMKDYYDEIDNEINNAYENEHGGSISLEKTLLGGSSRNQRFNIGGTGSSNQMSFGQQIIGSIISSDF